MKETKITACRTCRQKLLLRSAIIAVVICVTIIAFFLVSVLHNIRAKNAIQRATGAKIMLLEAVDVDPLIGDNPSYMLGRYIGDDYKLYIRMSESGREHEQALKEALGEYTDVVVFEYAAMYKIELSTYAKEVQTALTDQGIDVDDTRVSRRSGNIIVTIANEEDLSKAQNTAAKLEKFSQWIEVRVKTERYDMLTRDYNDPKYRTSMRASEHLMRYFYRQGYVTDYPDYYAGSYIGSDNLYYVVINKTAKNAEANMEEALSAYADDVVYEYANHSRNELQAYCDALSQQLVELGINVTSSGVSETDGVVSISVLEEDVHLAESLINRWAPYPFGHTDIKVEFSAGNYMILE